MDEGGHNPVRIDREEIGGEVFPAGQIHMAADPVDVFFGQADSHLLAAGRCVVVIELKRHS